MNENSTTHTFWGLVQECHIVIPPLQWDYAQGRENDSAIEQIRNSLVEELFDSLVNNKKLVLNFIYGEKEEGRFIPIDGQQRLTTLFLLHWYVFSRSKYVDGLQQLRNFSYQTRDTSKRFCEKICEENIDFSYDLVSEQIRECYWMTGNFVKDPTIKSMLIMLDAIHHKMLEWNDFEYLKNTLISDTCPISFLWLPMDNFQKTNDLYIKMNARGKLLTDFEIFKAKLQNSELLNQVLGNDISEKDKIIYISKYNNQYAELFYKLFGEEYDGAMMDFVKEMIRDSYLSYVSASNVSQKEYRANYSRIRQMTGSVFFKFIENGGSDYSQCHNPEKAIIDGLLRMTDLLDKFTEMETPLVFENTLTKDYYNEVNLFRNNHKIEQGLSEDVVRYALYAYLIKFGVPSDYTQKNAYCMWKRFVYNLVTNSDFAGRREDVCEAFVFIEKIVTAIADCDEAAVLVALSNIDYDNSTAAIRFQLYEEVIKAKLITDASWRKEIFDAEEYFSDGQIGFILEYCKKKDDEYDINEFKMYYQILKKLLDGNKKLLSEYNEKLFERTLLCMPDKTSNHTGHLIKQSNSTTSWGFVGRNYKEYLKNTTSTKKKDILKHLLDIFKIETNYENVMKNVISEMDFMSLDKDEQWKIPFIQNDLFDLTMGYYKFKNCINLSDCNKEVLLIAGTTVRAYSMELNTFLLYQEMQLKGIKANLILSTTAALMDHEGIPLRYIETSDYSIGYSYRESDIETPYIFKSSSEVRKMTLNEVRAMIF